MTTEAESQRAKLIAVAREKFATKGFEATTTREINAAVGMAEGLLYYYFPHGKKQLLDTIVQAGVAERLAQVDISLAGATDLAAIEAGLMRIFDQVWHVFNTESGYQSFVITIRERNLLSAQQSGWLDQLLEKIAAALANALVRVQPQLPALAAADCQTYSRVVLAVFQKSLYDELLIRNHRRISKASRAQVQTDLHLLLKLAAG
ncbi:TetR/AcrR family transcriptional regulator [Lacticaseibacillus jixianensis]|uniref:TetR/AcrR family transcriptional regulator n=1 Tax=Lacticaseibacillus jixianensis TaxID=2486012 RepID=A0ABW4BAR5_9LACO|nr:TetR/AcrR family transcriptional regulator [Lacticaseibacillus jixianensis]